jgi:hypothetical protein
MDVEDDVSRAADESRGARDSVAAQTEANAEDRAQQLQKEDDTTKQNTISQLVDGTNGSDISNPTQDVQNALGDLQKRVEAQDAIFKALGLDDVEGLKSDIASGKGVTSVLNKDSYKPFFKKLTDYLKSKFKTDEDIARAAKESKDAADKETDPTKRSNFKRNAYILAGLTIAGLTIAGLIELFIHLAKEKTGCYQLNVGSGKEEVKLDCQDNYNLSDDSCNCTALPALSAACTANGSSIDGDKCAPDGNYRYLYRHYSAWDVFCDFVDTAVDDLGAGVGAFASVLEFFTKYGVWILVGILLIALIPLVMKIIPSKQ